MGRFASDGKGAAVRWQMETELGASWIYVTDRIKERQLVSDRLSGLRYDVRNESCAILYGENYEIPLIACGPFPWARSRGYVIEMFTDMSRCRGTAGRQSQGLSAKFVRLAGLWGRPGRIRGSISSNGHPPARHAHSSATVPVPCREFS